MSAIITATVKRGSTSFKTSNLIVEDVTRNATAKLAIWNSEGKWEKNVKKGQAFFLRISSSSGLVKGDVLKASIVSTGDDGSALEEIELSNIDYIDGTECVWPFVIPLAWTTTMITIRVQHVNYYGRVIGTVYCNALA